MAHRIAARSSPAPDSRSGADALPQRAPFEQMLAVLSARFINLEPAEVDAAVTGALGQIVMLLGVERALLIRFRSDGQGADVTHSWAVDGVPAAQPRSVEAEFPWAMRRLRAGQPVVVERIDDLPPQAGVDKATWQRRGVRSNLTVPLRVGERVEGALAVACWRRSRRWSAEVVRSTGVLAEILSNALAHKRTRQALDEAMAFESSVARVLAALLQAAPGELDRAVEAGLGDVGRAIGVDRAALWQRIGQRVAFARSHLWLADGAASAAPSTEALPVPWIAAQLAAGSVVRFGSHAELPAQAAEDVGALRTYDVGAAVIVPVRVGGSVVGALAFGAADERHDWPDAMVPRATLLGEVFATLLARQAAEQREQEAQAQAAHASRVSSLGVVVASLVHELTQPLSACLTNAETAAEVLAAPAPDLDEVRAAVADIVGDSRRVADLIQQLRRSLRRGDAQRGELDFRELVRETVRFVAGEVAGHGIELTVDCPAALPSVVADRVQIQQVLLNLLLNAFDAVASNAPGARRVAIGARADETGGIAVEVTDNGCGMDEATLGRIFHPFFTTKAGGLGLGLSISHSIVAAHGGMLSVRSTPARGTTFCLDLPARASGRAPDADPAPAAASSGTVYVIDDDLSMRRALYRQLYAAGYRVETFASAEDYLERARPHGVACIVSDIRMPGLTGLDLQTFLAQAKRNVPIVFVSGHGDIPTTVHAIKAGAVGFLAKPFTRAELLAVVAEAMARSRAIEAAREEHAELQARYESLTAREREVLSLVTAGLLNKVIADRLGTVEGTVKVHRGRVMGKMHAASVADLVRMAERLNLPPVPRAVR
jgi:FixJ family two-component response regulator/C4-dicarboxylate-specific signal transduction histidine kinase